ncbi:hypothetical protein [Nocardiopsis valliformis]|uniref:hypothetical protein n=1 Tax=Nocardiopsis valliformis TaxID=239974 RepID=UPI00035CC69F|nr:hypothetical protein [Nocardiopsis valliformis]
MNRPKGPIALRRLSNLLCQQGIHPITDREGTTLVFLHIGCVSVSATNEHYVVEHLDNDANQLRVIHCPLSNIREAVRLVLAYRHRPHAHDEADARPCLHLVKGRRP